MQCNSYVSTSADSKVALEETVGRAVADMNSPSLAFLYVSPHHRSWLDTHFGDVQRQLAGACVLGCTAESIVGNGREIEQQPAMALWLARCPQASALPMHLEFTRTSDGGVIVGWPDEFEISATSASTLIVLGEPFSFPADYLLQQLNEDRPGVRALGGMASGAVQPGSNRLYLNGDVYDSGAVAVLLNDISVEAIVSQGCRPIGEPMVITQSDQNVIFELGGKSALHQLREIVDQLPNHERQLAQQGLHVGRVVNEYQERFESGDFLIRNVTGFDPDQGALAIGDFVRTGQTVQFHIRDEHSASRELRQLLNQAAKRLTPQGAMLFTCNGRGSRLFSVENHDAGMIATCWRDVPLAGFFAQGELGPVGGRNFVHGFTASVALFHAAHS